MTIQSQLAAILATAEAATAGPWTALHSNLHKCPHVGAKGLSSAGVYVANCSTAADGSGMADAAFIADARSTVPKLVRALQRALLTLESHPDSHSICLEDIEAILNEP